MSSEYPARLYAAVHTGNPGDADFYRRVCRDAGDVLELGCGTGRIGALLVRDGLRVSGIDHDPECVQLTEQVGVAARLGDMRDFALDARFDRIIAPYNGLYCLLEEEALVACFRRVAEHLRDHGEFWFDGYAVEGLHAGAGSNEAETTSVEFVGSVQFEGQTYDVMERGHWDRERQLVHASYEHIPRDRSALIETELPQRYLLSEQIPDLLDRGGLAMRRLDGDFDGGPVLPNCQHLVVCAQKAPS